MQQNLLYPETLLTDLPPSIKVYPDFITEGEERDLLEQFQKLDWKQLHMNGVIAKRKILHFGHESPPIYLEPIIARVAKLMKVKAHEIAEIQLTHYPQGAGIGWHQDAQAFGEVIAGISLLSDCVMKFRHEIGSQYEIFKTEIPHRSAYVIADEARWEWQHTIASHKTPRYSITFRTQAK